MTPARSNSKSRRKNKNKRSNSKIKKKRSSRQIKIKNMKKKINIPIEQGEKVEPMEIQLNDGSKIESHPSATVLQSLAQHDVKSAEKVHASNFGPPDKEQQSTVHEQQSTDYSEPSVVKLDDRNNTPLANVDPVDQDADKSTTKRMKISSIESDSSLNTFEDDLVFSEEDLITIDKSAEQHRLDVRDIDAQTSNRPKFIENKGLLYQKSIVTGNRKNQQSNLTSFDKEEESSVTRVRLEKRH
ncbi:hypothetical protein Fot_16514 [Forsythia ovata]|uniref:Uncharacterized protein n=1 Tax=Forsythia ovata TaxID=205694 RepID=A0ABD1WCI5_9LAMI